MTLACNLTDSMGIDADCSMELAFWHLACAKRKTAFILTPHAVEKKLNPGKARIAGWNKTPQYCITLF